MVFSKTLRCIKWLVFTFNFLFFLTGCCLIGFGVWLNVARNDAQYISDYSYISIANVVITVGCIIVLVSFLGCCGAITENKILLLLYFVFLLLIFLLEVGFGITAYIYRNKIKTDLKEQLEERIPERYYTDSDVEKAVNTIQEYFKCCGLYGRMDWEEPPKGANTPPRIDESCCILDSSNVNYSSNCLTRPWANIKTNPGLLKEYYENGCYDEIEDFMKDTMWLTAVFGFVFAGLEILGMVFSLFLYCSLRRQNPVY